MPVGFYMDVHVPMAITDQLRRREVDVVTAIIVSILAVNANKKVMIVVVALLLMLALHQFVQRTKWGMAMRAMSFDFVAVPLMGVPVNLIAADHTGEEPGL